MKSQTCYTAEERDSAISWANAMGWKVESKFDSASTTWEVTSWPAHEVVKKMRFVDVCLERDYLEEDTVPFLRVPVDSETTTGAVISMLMREARMKWPNSFESSRLLDILTELKEENERAHITDQIFCPSLAERSVVMRMLDKRQYYAYFELEMGPEEVEAQSQEEDDGGPAPLSPEVTRGKTAAQQMEALDEWIGKPKRTG